MTSITVLTVSLRVWLGDDRPKTTRSEQTSERHDHVEEKDGQVTRHPRSVQITRPLASLGFRDDELLIRHAHEHDGEIALYGWGRDILEAFIAIASDVDAANAGHDPLGEGVSQEGLDAGGFSASASFERGDFLEVTLEQLA